MVVKEGVIEVGENAFICCKLLEQLALPSTLVRIGKLAFGRTLLKEVNLPENITELGPFSFCQCDCLKHVIFPNGIQSSGDGAFKECKVLENTVLPFTVNSIGCQAFARCNSLRMVELTGGIQINAFNAFFTKSPVNAM